MKKTVIYLLVFNFLTLFSYAQDPDILSDKTLRINRIFSEQKYRLPPDSLMKRLLPEIWQERDSLLVQYAHRPKDQTAIKFYYGAVLFDLSQNMIQKFERGEPWQKLAEKIFLETPLPQVASLEHSKAANLFLDTYVANKLRELFLLASENGDLVVEQAIGRPVDSLKLLAGQHGDQTLAMFYAKKCLPAELASYYLSIHLSEQIGDKNLILADMILEELKQYFPTHASIPQARQEMAELRQLLAANRDHPEIVFIENSDSIGSVAELLVPFAGKVVYLDFWGTWCGPCVQELSHHTQSLKERFKDQKDLVFLYIAMERPMNHEKWRQFIALHELTGYHLTRTSKTLEAWWEELLGTKDVPRSYPTYMIFDRKGNLVTDQALRPSDGEALYLQLEETLNK